MSRARTLSKLFNTDGNLNLSPVESINGNAPFGRKNFVINGDFKVAQRGASFSSQQATAFHLDRFEAALHNRGTEVYTVDQSTTTPDGFLYSADYGVSAADTSPDANLQFYVGTHLEAQDLGSLKYFESSPDSVTISFWVRSNLTGEFGMDLSLGVSNSSKYNSSNKIYPTTYTISTANTWTKIEKTIPLDSSSLTKSTGTNMGMGLRFWLSAGSSRRGSTANAWRTNNNQTSTSVTQYDFFSSTNNEWYVTGIQIERGSVASDFENRGYDTELQLCKRYFQPYSQYVEQSNGTTGSFGNTPVAFAPAMRVSPTFVATTSNGSSSSLNAMTVRGSAADGYFAYSFNYSTTTSGYFYLSRRGTADAEF